MKVGDLVEYSGWLRDERTRELGTVVRVGYEARSDECYVVWHTTRNEGWWYKRIMKVAGKHEGR